MFYDIDGLVASLECLKEWNGAKRRKNERLNKALDRYDEVWLIVRSGMMSALNIWLKYIYRRSHVSLLLLFFSQSFSSHSPRNNIQ